MKWTPLRESYPPINEVVLMGRDELTTPGLYMFGNESMITEQIKIYGWLCWCIVELPK